MPVYEYQCTSCDFSFEERQGFDADPVCDCPKCKGESRRLFKPAPIIFKGKGFYVTDYASTSSTCTTSNSDSCESSKGSSGACSSCPSSSASKATATKADKSTSDK